MRLLRLLGLGLLLAAFILYILLPMGFGIYASVPQRDAVGDPPAGFKDVTLTTSDGVSLVGWSAPTQNGAAIVLLHGGASSREGIRSYASMLADHGFGVLALDLRGHGESGGGANAFGWEGTRDVGAALAYLREQEGVRTIGGIGISLGGEVLLGAASTYPELRAIVSDGATHRCLDDYLALPARRNLAYSWTTRVMYASTRVFSGDTPPFPILDSITSTEETALLLVAAGDVPDEILYNERFREAAGGRAALWVVPDVGHTRAFRRHPADYEKRVVTFFESNFLEEGAPGTADYTQ